MKIRIELNTTEAVDEVRTTTERELYLLAEDLGLPIDFELEIAASSGEAPKIRLVVDGAVVPGAPDPQRARRERLADQVAQHLHASRARLVTPKVADRVWRIWTAGRSPCPPAFHRLLVRLVDHRVRIDRVAPAAKAWDRTNPTEAFEEAFSAVSRRIQILLHPNTARRCAQAEEKKKTLPFMIDGLFVELGIFVGEALLVSDPQVMPKEMRVTMGDLRGAPMTLVPDGMILVNDTTDRLRLGDKNIDARATTNPATGQPAAYVPAEKKEELEAQGLTTWDELGMVVLATAAELRGQAHALLSLDALVHLLGSLGEAYPKLADLARARIGERRLAEVLRLLLRECVGVRNLPLIIETLFAMPPVAAIDDQRVVFASLLRPAITGNPMPDEQDLAEMAETVRGGLKHQLSHQFSRGTGTLVCYLLDPKIDDLLRTPGPLDATDEHQILTAIINELGFLPPTAQTPVFLVTPPIRARLRRIIEPWLPHLSVLSFQELAPELNVQPVARISLR